MDPAFTKLPYELHNKLSQYLSARDIVSLAQTSNWVRDVYAPLSFKRIIVFRPKTTSNSTEQDALNPRFRPITANVFFHPLNFAWFRPEHIQEIHIIEDSFRHLSTMPSSRAILTARLYSACHTIHVVSVQEVTATDRIEWLPGFLRVFQKVDLKLKYHPSRHLDLLGDIPTLSTFEFQFGNRHALDTSLPFLGPNDKYTNLEKLALDTMVAFDWNILSPVFEKAPLKEFSLSVDPSCLANLLHIPKLPATVEKVHLHLSVSDTFFMSEEQLPNSIDLTKVTDLSVTSTSEEMFFSAMAFFSSIKLGKLRSLNSRGSHTHTLLPLILDRCDSQPANSVRSASAATALDRIHNDSLLLKDEIEETVMEQMRLGFEKNFSSSVIYAFNRHKDMLKTVTKLNVNLSFSIYDVHNLGKKAKYLTATLLDSIIVALLDNDMRLLKEYIFPREEEEEDTVMQENGQEVGSNGNDVDISDEPAANGTGTDATATTEITTEAIDTNTTTTADTITTGADAATNGAATTATAGTATTGTGIENDSSNVPQPSEDASEQQRKKRLQEFVKAMDAKDPNTRSSHIPLEKVLSIFHGYQDFSCTTHESLFKWLQFDGSNKHLIQCMIAQMYLERFMGVINNIENLEHLLVTSCFDMLHSPQYHRLIHTHPKIKQVFWHDICRKFYLRYDDRVLNKKFIKEISFPGMRGRKYNETCYLMSVEGMRNYYNEELFQNDVYEYYEKKQNSNIMFLGPGYKKSIFGNNTGCGWTWNSA